LEPFKTTSLFDGTARNPEWLGEEPERVQAMGPAGGETAAPGDQQRR
jgi:hypothetical protein